MELEAENARLKRAHGELTLKNAAIRTFCRESDNTVRQARGGRVDGNGASPVDCACLRTVRLSRSAYSAPTEDWAQRDADALDIMNGFMTGRTNFNRESPPVKALLGLVRIWWMDFMHDAMYNGRRFRRLNVIGDGNREALCMECRRTLPSVRMVRVMELLVEAYVKPEAIREDDGPKFTDDEFTGWAERNSINLLYIELLHVEPGKPNQHAFVERFSRTCPRDVLKVCRLNRLGDVRRIAGA